MKETYCWQGVTCPFVLLNGATLTCALAGRSRGRYREDSAGNGLFQQFQRTAFSHQGGLDKPNRGMKHLDFVIQLMSCLSQMLNEEPAVKFHVLEAFHVLFRSCTVQQAADSAMRRLGIGFPNSWGFVGDSLWRLASNCGCLPAPLGSIFRPQRCSWVAPGGFWLVWMWSQNLRFLFWDGYSYTPLC